MKHPGEMKAEVQVKTLQHLLNLTAEAALVNRYSKNKPLLDLMVQGKM